MRVGIVLLAALALSNPSLPTSDEKVAQTGAASVQPLIYFCPMHPDVTAEAPGTCRKCGMALVAGVPFDTTDYGLSLETTPRLVKAGQPARLSFRVTHPLTGEPVRAFTIVHDEPYHLFVVSQDMKTFFHVHPIQQPDGSLVIDLTLPEPGPYRLFSDFLPAGGTPQIIVRPLLTAGFAGDLLSSAARLAPDRILERIVDGMEVDLAIEPGRLIAGRNARLTFHLTDEETHQPITDLQPYLAAWGHTLVLSEDMVEYIHSHPVERVPAEGRESLKGGPSVTFDAFFPKPGMYRSWTQFKRHYRVSTIAFTFRVYRLGEGQNSGTPELLIPTACQAPRGRPLQDRQGSSQRGTGHPR